MTASEILACSFCLTGSDEVTRLLGSPSGVHICDECVAACDAILADPTVAFPAFDHDDDTTLLGRLARAEGMAAAADRGLLGLVALLRERDISWARIGDALGTSRQAAWERFAARLEPR